jgi:preprotein translocase subunit SecF
MNAVSGHRHRPGVVAAGARRAHLLFGRATLQDFAFAILVGIGVGAVSTVLVATPLLVGLMERQG